MANLTYYLKLVEKAGNNNYELQVSKDNITFTKVTATNPSDTVTPGDVIEWIADSATIRKIQIIPDNQKILKRITQKSDDDVEAGTTGAPWDSTESYVIKAQPKNGGGLKEWDPEVKTPPQS